MLYLNDVESLCDHMHENCWHESVGINCQESSFFSFFFVPNPCARNIRHLTLKLGKTKNMYSSPAAVITIKTARRGWRFLKIAPNNN